MSTFLVLLLGALLPVRANTDHSSNDDSASRRASAHDQFARAETLRAALEAKSERERSVKDYKDVVTAYRRVYLITSHAVEVPDALDHVAALYRKMGEQFERTYFDSAVETYEFLLHEYPESRYRETALLAIADIQRNGLAESNLAQKTYEDFLEQHPHSPNAEQARRALAEIQSDDHLGAQVHVQPKTQPDIQNELPAAPPDAPGAAGDDHSASSSEVSHIHVWNADTYTRIVIDLGDQAKYQAARISNPDRIYFDIENAKLSNELIHEAIAVPSDGYLKTVRVAQNRSNVVRVVLEVSQVKDYSVFELANPDRLVVDVYGPKADAAKGSSLSVAGASAAVPSGPSSGPASGKAVVAAAVTAAGSTTKTGAPSTRARGEKNEAGANLNETPTAKVTARASSSAPAPRATAAAAVSASKSSARHDSAALASDKTASKSFAPAATAEEDLPEASLDSPKKVALAETASSIPQPMHNGTQSLTRALGLKIGRIVLDAGHGGHDTGTIGPTGLMEKDVCLDIALRVGKLVEARLPAAEITYTRQDDSFVSLEKRTRIANNAKADLFLSIHANSSDDPATSGIETYYLNFNASPGAMEVASRENALTQSSVHDLQDLVNKITQNEKIEESHDLAVDIQNALSKKMENTLPSERDRGVRKAPFVVLIGAKMPSVLTEISFLSNPTDEQWLKKPENRQRVAEGLYRGIESYLQSTNSLTSALGSPARLSAPSAPDPPSISARTSAHSSAHGTTDRHSSNRQPAMEHPVAEHASEHPATDGSSASDHTTTAVARSSDPQ